MKEEVTWETGREEGRRKAGEGFKVSEGMLKEEDSGWLFGTRREEGCKALD